MYNTVYYTYTQATKEIKQNQLYEILEQQL